MQTVCARTGIALIATVGLAALGIGNAPVLASPSVAYNVTLDTSSLTTNTSYTGPFALDFQFVDGDGSIGSPNVNNTVTVTSFAGGSNFSLSSFTLSDGEPSATPPTGAVQISFMPGATLSFLATLTTNQDMVQPDMFSVGILQKYGAAGAADITTQDSNGFDAYGSLATITESGDAANPTALSIATYDTAAGEFMPSVTPAPEPSAALTWLVGILATGTLLASRPLRRKAIPVSSADECDRS